MRLTLLTVALAALSCSHGQPPPTIHQLYEFCGMTCESAGRQRGGPLFDGVGWQCLCKDAPPQAPAPAPTRARYRFTLAQHETPPRDSASPEEKCKDSCHKEHCDCWVGCAEQLNPLACKDLCSQREDSCSKSCTAPKT